ncbi:serine/threonine-protein kinase par-1-like [Lineus longissimus]|uniref:serine/threonine-protein kinase par-1-like n=1 Tax=Lineus longissimus TaxID=88925 RepID=UPI002B4CC882
MVTLTQSTPLDSNYPTKNPDEIIYRRMRTMASGEHLPNKVTEVPKEVLRNFPHSKRVGNYLLGRTLGEGSFAKVKEGLHTLTGEKVAVKIIDKKKAKEDSYVRKNLRREGKLLQVVRHTNVAQLYEIMETENCYYLVLELCEGGDLMEHICNKKRLEEKEVRKYMRQIISAVEYLHRAGILHRDLKVENLLLSQNKDVKIIDFGLSNSVKVTHTNDGYKFDEFLVTQCGSPAYAAPELLANKKYGPQVDVWSIGVNMYAMLTGNLPFTVHPFNIKTLQNKMTSGDMNALPESITRGCRDLVKKLLTSDPEKRISLREAMQHPWLTEGRNRPLEPAMFPNRLRADELDQNIIKHMSQNMDFKMSEIIRMVVSNIPHSTTASYHLFRRKLIRYTAVMNVMTKVAASDARHSVSSLPSDGKPLTAPVRAVKHLNSPTKIVRPTPITLGAMVDLQAKPIRTEIAATAAGDGKDSDGDFLEIQLSRRPPGTRRRVIRRQVKNDRILTRILNVRNNIPVTSQSTDSDVAMAKNPGITTDAFQLDKTSSKSKRHPEHREIKLKLPDANKKTLLVSHDCKGDLPWKHNSSRGSPQSDLPDLIKKFANDPRPEENRENIVKRPVREAGEGRRAPVEDVVEKACDATERSKESPWSGSDKEPVMPGFKQHVTPRESQNTLAEVIEKSDGASSRVVTRDFPQAELVVFSYENNSAQHLLDLNSTTDDSEGAPRSDNRPSQDDNDCSKMNSNYDTKTPIKEDGVDSSYNPDTWKDYMSKRKVVDISNYETFARARSKTVPVSACIGQFPTKDCVKELMTPCIPTEQQIKIRTHSTRSNKMNLQMNRPVQPRYYYNSPMNHDRILKRRDTQENRRSVSSSRDSVADSLDIGRGLPPVEQPPQDNNKSHVGLPSISPAPANKRT